MTRALRIAVSSWSFHAPFYAGSFSLLNAPAAARRCGIPLLELNDFMLPPPRFSRLRRPLLRLAGAPETLWRYSAATRVALQRALAGAGVACVAWTADSDLTVTGRWAWRAQRRYVAAAAATAAALGCTLLRLTLGPRATAANALLARRLATLVTDTPPQLRLAVENHGGAGGDSRRMAALVHAARDLLGGVGERRLGVCLDAGNLFGEPADQLWTRLLPLATQVHVKTRAFTPSGDEATIDYHRFFQLLHAAAYQGVLSIEYEGAGDPAVGIARSQALILRHGPEFVSTTACGRR